jgi:hypothetical protein
LEKLFKVLRRTAVLDCYANELARSALGEIVESLKAMIGEMVKYALEAQCFSEDTAHGFLRDV